MSVPRREMQYDEQQLRREARRAARLAENTGPVCGLGGAALGLALGFLCDNLTVGLITFGAGLFVGTHMGLVWSTSLLLVAQSALCQAEMARASREAGPEGPA